ncbi:uncharacterized protein I303_101025 [Kwoniella dejecticola CBS 10117]|uniref:CSC1/OSCA1-like 7TM region domain-containing protein n=1 Tax=Kwoniella dejecticola CBS 10117 TaxID=1296121 RepID=A0AAJ8KHN8_9TREE
MPEHCGLDLTLHARFLRGAFFYTLLQTIVILPDIAKTSMLRASASSLVKSSGSRWLWVHALLIWWITITWTATVLWITWGGLAYRRRQIKELAVKIAAEREAKRNISRGEEGEDDAASTMDESKGIKRFRTLMVTNIPPDMRDEHILRDYFDYYLQRHHSRKRSPAQTRPQINKPRLSLNGLEMQRHEWTNEESEIDEVILVRKLNTIASLRERRQDVLRKLEIAHVNLAKRVLAAAARHKKSMVGSVATMEKSIGAPLQPGASKTERLGRLVQALDPFLDSNGSAGKMDTTALHALPRELIDPYQSLTHITSLFRDQNAPLIDYLTTKLSYLTMLLDESRSRPLSDYSPSSAAFISFKDARTARLAAKILDSHPKRSLACHAVAAPDWTDILWHRLGKTTYRSEFVRGWVVYLGVWAFTLVWAFLNAHPKVASAITSLAPVILVALLTIAICPILLVIANKAETIVTRLGIHNSVLERFWKFLMVNGVVFFAIGQSTIEAYLTAFQNKNFDPLPIIASAFPTAAPYFASYILLQTAIQPFFEIFRFGRFSRTEHPTFSHFSQVPQQRESSPTAMRADLSVLGGAIMHLFMLLNPLVIPFSESMVPCMSMTNVLSSGVLWRLLCLDALALGQFVLFAFFILNKAKGHAIATGILFALTLIAKLIITRALKSRFKSEDDECEDDSASADWENNDAENAPFDPVSSSRFHTLRRSVGRWAGSWKKAGSSHKPIPFDHVLFSTLDSKISFDPPTTPSTREETQGCDEDMDLPNGQIAEVQQIVVPHHRLEAWEDIPPYYRSRGYDDQPSYTDDYDDFLWLPRDPLSTLDLDDTVEMRVTLTTTAGGTGQIGDLASTTECGEITVRKSEQDTWQDVMNHRAEDERATSPGANSETGLMATPSHIGSEVNDTFSGSHLFRRHTHKAATAWSEVFRRPRASSTNSNPAISLEPIITTNRQDTPSPLLVGGQDGFPTMARVSTPSAMSERQDSDPDQEETLTPAEPPSGSHISFAATLGRSPSGRRPTRLRSNSSNRSGGGPLTSPTTARNRSLSHLSPQRSRTASAMSAQQQLLWDEVMREETLARHEDIQEERAEMEKEKEEVIKEQDKMRKASLSGSVEGGGLRRRLTRGNSEGSRPRLERAGDSARSRNGSVALVETPSSVEHTS